MNAKQTAIEYADQVLSLIPQLIHQAVEERRKHACWWEAYRRKRLAMCHPFARPAWRLLLKRSQAMCAANREMAQACALASARVRPSGLASVLVLLFSMLAGCVCIDEPVDEPCESVWPDCEGIGNACIDGACGFVSLECEASEECQAGYVCGDTRACSLPCDSRAGCQGGLVCPETLGYCSDPCDSDDDCDLVPGAVCDAAIGVCWYEPDGL